MEFVLDVLDAMSSSPLGWLLILLSVISGIWALRMLSTGRTMRFVNFVFFTFLAGLLGYLFGLVYPQDGTHGSAAYFLPLQGLVVGTYLMVTAVVAAVLGSLVRLVLRNAPGLEAEAESE